jgi:vacuolar-type H+-ATPase subunit H
VAIEKVLEIKEVEAEAKEIRRKASEETKQLMEKGRQEILDAAIKAETDSGEIYKQKLEKAESEASIIYDSIILDAEKNCELLVSRAEKNKKSAVSIIVERIVV